MSERLCANCDAVVRGVVRRRLGPHRFRGRFANRISDVVHDCYVQILGPGGLPTFVAPPDAGALCGAFRRWLWGLAQNACHNATGKLGRQLRETCGDVPERSEHESERTFARLVLQTTYDLAISEVRGAWVDAGKGPRFDVLLAWLNDMELDYGVLARTLGVKVSNARKLVSDWRANVRTNVYLRLADGLELGPHPSHAARYRAGKVEFQKLLELIRPVPGPEPNGPEPNREQEAALEANPAVTAARLERRVPRESSGGGACESWN